MIVVLCCREVVDGVDGTEQSLRGRVVLVLIPLGVCLLIGLFLLCLVARCQTSSAWCPTHVDGVYHRTVLAAVPGMDPTQRNATQPNATKEPMLKLVHHAASSRSTAFLRPASTSRSMFLHASGYSVSKMAVPNGVYRWY